MTYYLFNVCNCTYVYNNLKCMCNVHIIQMSLSVLIFYIMSMYTYIWQKYIYVLKLFHAVFKHFIKYKNVTCFIFKEYMLAVYITQVYLVDVTFINYFRAIKTWSVCKLNKINLYFSDKNILLYLIIIST